MQNSLLTTKFYLPPARSALVPRPRLLELLQTGLCGPLTLISAPAGAGKTTLLSEWRAGPGARYPVAWLSLDEGDNDPSRFYHYLAASLDTLHPGLLQEILPLLQTTEPPHSEAILTALINILNEIQSDFILAIDDYHLIEAEGIHAGLMFLLDHLPPSMHIVLLTRSDPALPLARLRGRGHLTEIREEHLRFTFEEASAFLRQVMGLELTSEQIVALEKRTEGWVAGLQLAALSMRGREDVNEFVSAFTGSNHYIMDYLADEVLSRQSEEIQEFLLKTSILNRLTGPLCNALLGRSDGNAVLSGLEHSNLFVVSLDSEQKWYRYHSLFSDLLRHQMSYLHPEQLISLHARAAEWYEQNGLFFDAMDHLLAAGEFDHACGLIEKNILSIMREHLLLEIARWMTAIPDEVVRSYPRVCLLFGYGKESLGDINAYNSYIQSAERAVGQSADRFPPGSPEHASIWAEIKINQADIAIRHADLDTALILADEALALAPASDHFVRSQAYLYAGWAKRELGQFEQAFLFCERALPEAQFARHPGLTASSVSMIGGLLKALGFLQRSLQAFQDGLQYAVEMKQNRLPIYANVHYELAKVYRELNDMDKAEKQMEQGRILSIQGGRPLETIEGYVVEVWLRIVHGDQAGILKILEKAFREERRTGIQQLHDELMYYRVKVLADAGNPRDALEWLKDQADPFKGIFGYIQCTSSLRSAHVLLALGRWDEASEFLARVLAATEACHCVGWQIETLVLLACAAYRKGEGDLAQALDFLNKGLRLAEPEGYLRVFLDEGQPMVNLLHLARQKGIAPEYIGKLLSAAFKVANQDLSDQKAGTVLLSKRELELLRLVASGCSNKEIARQLVISVATVKRHTTNIFNKLDAKNRTDAVTRARESGLL